jgi:chromosome segregation ATPase
MNEGQDQNFNLQSGTPRWFPIAVVILAGISLVSLGLAWSASSHARSVEATANAAIKQNVDALNQRLAAASETNAQVQSDLKVIEGKLQLTEGQLAAARKQNKAVGAQLDKKLSAVESSVKSELATKASAEDVNRLNGDVTGVKTDLDATKNSIQMARGELGTLIARNHEEIDQLRRFGQRDYFEFTLTRKGGPQKIGDVQVELRHTNIKKNQFTIVVHADDSRFEKKNRSVNEPIYFYTNGSRSALELVVNKVAKDRATGYMSVPKAQPAAASTSGSASGL